MAKKTKTDEEASLKLQRLKIGLYIRLLEQEETPTDEQKRLLKDLKQEQFQTGFFYATRLLIYSGNQIDETSITKILKVGNIEINESQVQEAVKQYNEKQKQLVQKQKQKTAQTSFETEDAMLLKLSEEKDGTITSKLEEDLELAPSGTSNLEKLVRIFGIMTSVEDIKTEYVFDKRGEEKRLTATLKLRGIKKFKSLEKALLQEKLLYRKLQASLFQKMKKVERERRADPQSLQDEIVYFTNLLDTYEEMKKLTKLTYFLKELYGVIQLKGVTRQQILSSKKSRSIAKNRHTIMYILKNKFPWLSSTMIAKIMSEPGKKSKNHATVLSAFKLFKYAENRVGIRPSQYEKVEDARELYEDAIKKYRSFTKTHKGHVTDFLSDK